MSRNYSACTSYTLQREYIDVQAVGINYVILITKVADIATN